MSKLIKKVLEALQEQGVTLPSDGLGADAMKKLAELDGTAVLQAEIDKARQEKADLEARYKGMTKTDSEKDSQIKALQKQLEDAKKVSPPPADNTAAAQLQEVQKQFSAQMQTLLDKLDAQEKESQRLAAQVARTNIINNLASEFPVLKDPDFHALIPETADETALRDRAELLTRFRDATQDMAVEQVRSGHISATTPPKFSKSRPETFDNEVARMERLVKSGEMTHTEFNRRIDDMLTEWNKSK